MISIEDAINKVRETSLSIQPKKIVLGLLDALGMTLSKDILSPINMPPFNQSAMDGYALFLKDTNQYDLINEIKAGDNKNPVLKKGDAVRIFTGAPVPDTANAVIMQEKTTVEGDQLTIQGAISEQQNIRPLGEQIQKNAIALEKGTLLNPAAIGFLATLGITEVEVFKKPAIAVLVTGNELVQPGRTLEHGQIYESNSIMLQAALLELDYTDVQVFRMIDDFQKTKDLIESLIKDFDVVVMTGGISVGDYDFVGKSLNELKVNQIFYKVNQKPGKPFYFGIKNDTLIFALPGNPAAALSCFYVYIRPTLRILNGEKNCFSNWVEKQITTDFDRIGNRANFLKAIVEGEEVSILGSQSSAMLNSFAVANALAYLPVSLTKIKAGDSMKVILLN